jgi:hypothetical protein
MTSGLYRIGVGVNQRRLYQPMGVSPGFRKVKTADDCCFNEPHLVSCGNQRENRG